MTGLTVENIHKSFNHTLALDGVSLTVSQGEIVAILGPSGCGKSTLLAIIAGLENADQGEILWDQERITHIPTYRRGFGLMFQDYMLFPHKNVRANVAFGLEMLDWEPTRIDERVDQLLEFVGLTAFGPRDIHTLSGGEQQRVALARSLAPNPRLLMLDEPFSSLDRALRERLIFELSTILRSMNQTAVYVTHDQEEAFALADRVVLMDLGRVIQTGTPQEIYAKPASPFVARFLGFKNIFKGLVQAGSLRTPIGDFPLADLSELPTAGFVEGDTLDILIRPDRVNIDGTGTRQLSAMIKEHTFRGGLSRILVDVAGNELVFEFQTGIKLPGIGEKIFLHYHPEIAIQIL